MLPALIISHSGSNTSFPPSITALGFPPLPLHRSGQFFLSFPSGEERKRHVCIGGSRDGILGRTSNQNYDEM